VSLMTKSKKTMKATKQMKPRRRRKTIPYWQGVVAVILMFIAILETGWALYLLKFDPPFKEQTETIRHGSFHYEKKWDCLPYLTQTICCEQSHWATTRNLTSNETVRYTHCFKFVKG
jgi:quinol-cytochrome oxidoreductase complex cytochrome b subunit